MIRIVLFAVVAMQIFYSCNSGKINEKDSSPKAADTIVESNNDAQFPKSAPVCYESSSANTDLNKRIQLNEYIQLWNEHGKVTGRGAGQSEGSPNWIFKFNGTLINDTTIQVKVNYYSEEGVASLSTSETWIIDKEKARMHLANDVSGRPGADAYFEIDGKDLPDGMLKLMQESKDE